MAGPVTLPSSPAPASGWRRELEDRRGFLLRSIEDLDAERAAGDISEDDYRALRDRYVARAAEVLRALEDGPGEAPAAHPEDGPDGTPAVPAAAEDAASAPTRRRRRRILLGGAVALFAAAAVVLVVAEVTARLPGQTATGSIALSHTQQLQRTLAQAQVLESEGKDSQALALYHQVLRQDPTQEQALAESGWLEFEAGAAAKDAALLSTGQTEEQQAERADAGAYAPHLYLGSMLLVEEKFQEAVGEYTQFLADDPPVSLEQTAWPYVVRAFDQAHEAVPPVPAGVSG
jgi:tetratricopeptide (TPR) repeat protein